MIVDVKKYKEFCVKALVNCGVKPEAAEAVAAAYEEGITLEVLIKKALKIASGSKFS